MPEANVNIRVKDVLERDPQQIEVVESVCQVDRLQEVCSMGFSSIPVVNMAGRIIGLIPANFIIVLIEQHQWYEEEKVIRGGSVASEQVSNYYTTALKRMASMKLSEGDPELDIDSQDNSPRGSIKGGSDEKDRMLSGSGDQSRKNNLKKVEPVVEKIDSEVDKKKQDADESINYRDSDASKDKKLMDADEVEFKYSDRGSNHLQLG